MKRPKRWPNGLGYDYGKWELVPWKGTWYANYKPYWETVLHGIGRTWREAILNAKPIEGV